MLFCNIARAYPSTALEPLSKGHRQVTSVIKVRSSSTTTSGLSRKPESVMVSFVVIGLNLTESVILVTTLL